MGWFEKKRKTPFDEQTEKIKKALEKTDYVAPERSLKECEPEPEPKPEEFVEVEGFKGTDINGCAIYGNKTQFAIGDTFEIEGPLELCQNGYHFSLNLIEAMGYYPPRNGNRYFKVKAMVRQKILINMIFILKE